MAGLILSGCTSGPLEKDAPSLIVQITIDGLRADLLEDCRAELNGGFERLRREGLLFSNARVDHAITVSHAGHVTLATGMHPAQHGIVDAAFYTPAGDSRILVDAVADSTESIPGMPGQPGVSPVNVMVSGLPEWTRNADANARILAVGSGNISSLLYVSHAPADVYWYRNGRYVTSSYYAEEYPDWVDRYNDEVLPENKRKAAVWTPDARATTSNCARPDDEPFEGDHVHTTFPHRIEAELGDALKRNPVAAANGWFAWTPSLDMATLELARNGIESMRLGQRESTDYLAIVLSMVDSNSHYYGPKSVETVDTLLKIDVALDAFFEYLDQVVGDDEYLVVLSADHGFPEVTEVRRRKDLPGLRLTVAAIDSVMERVDALSGDAGAVEDYLRTLDFVADVYGPSDLESASNTTDEFLRLYRHSWRPDRVPRLPLMSLRTFESSIGKHGLMVRLTEGAAPDIDAATHGSPYEYDRRVPLIFMGSNIPSGVLERDARTVDIAPTAAALSGLDFPDDVDGKVLFEAGRKE